jgi:hypothetical protein
MILRRAPLIVALAVFAAGLCARPAAFAQAAAPPQRSPQGAPQGAPTAPTPNYRAIIAKGLRVKDVNAAEPEAIPYFTSRGGIFPASAKIDHVEAADTIRMVQTNYFGWAWQTCIRLNLNGKPVTYAVFISEGRVVDARSAIIVDHCERDRYAPLTGAALR